MFKDAAAEANAAETAATQETEQEAPAADTATPAPGQEEPAQATDWKAEARKWEARAKENFAAVKERDALTKALSSKDADIDKLRAQVAGFEHEKKVAALVAQVSTDTGVPAKLLRGETLEELTEHATAIQEAMKARPYGPSGAPVRGIENHPKVSASPMDELRSALFDKN